MPRYYFHIYDDAVVRDEEGLELPDAETARRKAVEGARSLIHGQVTKGRLVLSHRIEVEDEAGEVVVSLAFADAISIIR